MALPETTGTDPTIYYLHGLGLVAQSDGVSTEYFAYDGLGSVRQVADSSGDVLLAQTFDPYGVRASLLLSPRSTREAVNNVYLCLRGKCVFVSLMNGNPRLKYHHLPEIGVSVTSLQLICSDLRIRK
jgi:hypothetical protein